MKFGDTHSNEIEVDVEPGETLHLGAEFLRSPTFSRSTIPQFWTRLLPDAFFGRLFAGKLWDLYVTAGETPEKVRLGGNEPKGSFLVVTVEPHRKLFLRLRHMAAYAFGPGGGFCTSLNVLSPSRWVLKAVSAAMVRGPATLVFYGVELKASEIEAGGHSFADQLLAFDATTPFRLHGLLPEGHDPAAHGTNITSTTVDVEFAEPATVVKKTTRTQSTNRLSRLWRLLFLSLLGGWLVEQAVMRPWHITPPPPAQTAFTGKVNNCTFALGDFRPKHVAHIGSLEAAFARRVDSVGLERLALVQGSRAMWWLPGMTGNQLHDDPDGSLVTLFADAYRNIAADPGFEDVRSAMPWCWAGVGADAGDGFVFVPASRITDKAAKDAAPTIVFLHGYGGSLLWNLWALKVSFPDHVILMPSGGIEWPDQDAAVIRRYVRALIEDVQTKHGLTIDRPWLFSLSQGGPTGFRLAGAYPDDFKGYVAIATWAGEPSAIPVNRDFPILMVNGDKDERVTLTEARNSSVTLKARGANVRQEVFAGADHYFFLSERARLQQVVHDFMAEQMHIAVVREAERQRGRTPAQPVAPPPPPPVTMRDLVGEYRGWRPPEDNRTITFMLHEDGTFLAKQKPDKTTINEGAGLITQGRGRWHLHDGRLTVTQEEVATPFAWVESLFGVSAKATWIDGAPIARVTEEHFGLGAEYNPLIKK